mmetsp:Transcript_158294/g.295178  ORF Transcript_158294/g.295178 Transcript_158294/m.295178 type:complete len:202 (-) Transcript_158294:893-1498(-)
MLLRFSQQIRKIADLSLSSCDLLLLGANCSSAFGRLCFCGLGPSRDICNFSTRRCKVLQELLLRMPHAGLLLGSEVSELGLRSVQLSLRAVQLCLRAPQLLLGLLLQLGVRHSFVVIEPPLALLHTMTHLTEFCQCVQTLVMRLFALIRQDFHLLSGCFQFSLDPCKRCCLENELLLQPLPLLTLRLDLSRFCLCRLQLNF